MDLLSYDVTFEVSSGRGRVALKLLLLGAVIVIPSVAGLPRWAGADMNGDGKHDVLLYNPLDGGAYPLISNGDGTFRVNPPWATTWSLGYDIVRLGDFNGDGIMDVLLYRSSDGLTYLGIGDGAGGFGFHNLIFSPGYMIEVGDLDGDGKADLILYNKATGTAYFATGWNGSNFTYYTYTLWSPNYTRLCVGDYDGDGKSDVLLYRYDGSSTWLATGYVANSGFASYYPQFFSANFDFLQSGDVNGDGKAELIVYNSGNASAYMLFLDPGTHYLTSYGTAPLFLSPGYTQMQVTDVTGDGKADLLVYSQATGTAWLGVSQISQQTGTFAFGSSPVWSLPGYDVVEPRDLNGDGRMDFVLFNSTSGWERSYISNGAGGFSSYADNYWSTPRKVDSSGGESQDYVLSATSAAIPAGQSGSVMVSLTPLNGFGSQVTLTCNWPTGFTGGCSPNWVNPNSSTPNTVTVAPGVPSGGHTLTISGTGGGMSRTATFVVNVTQQAQPDFTINAPQAQTISPGQYVSNLPVTFTPLNGFTGTVNFSITSSPSGFSSYFQTVNGVPRIFLSTSNTVASGSYTVNFQGVSGDQTITHTSSLSLTIDRLTIGANLGPVDFDNYSDSVLNNAVPAQVPGCSSTLSVRQCYRNALTNYASQGTSSIRFFFGLNGGGSTAMDFTSSSSTYGQVFPTWTTKLNNLFADMYSAGITHAHVNPIVFDTWGTPAYPLVSVPDTCSPAQPNIDLEFRPHLPFPIKQTYTCDASPPKNCNCSPCDKTCQCADVSREPEGAMVGGKAYDCVNRNDQNFWGWSPLYNLIDTVLMAAAAQGVTVDEVELLGDTTPISIWSVGARFLYDNKRNEGVLGHLQNTMANRMGQAAKYNVGFSFGEYDAKVVSSDAAADCTSIYGDSARILEASEFLAATAAGVIGDPYMVPPPPNGPGGASVIAGLQCGGHVDGAIMWDMSQGGLYAYGSSTPTLLDMHTHSNLIAADGSNTNTDIQGQATLTFNALKKMFDGYGPTDPGSPQFWHGYNPTVYNAFAVFGETWKNADSLNNKDKYGGTCADPPDPTNANQLNYQGFTSSTMSTPTAHPSVLLPYVDLVHGCYNFPPSIAGYSPRP